MNQNDLAQTWEQMALNSTKASHCPICKQEKETIQVKHPFKDEMTTVTPICKCENDEYVKFKEEQDDKKEQRKINHILKMSSDLAAIKEFTFDNYEVREGNEVVVSEIKKAVNNFDNNEGRGIFIFGVTGNGKSHITAAGGNELLKRGYSVIFLTEKDLLNRLKATNNFNNHETFSDVMRAATSADLLVWDDFLSSNKLSSDEKDWIFQIINGRERAKKPIWYTTNMTAKQFNDGVAEFVLDSKGRTWWRILANVDAIYNKSSNYRKVKVMNRVKGL